MSIWLLVKREIIHKKTGFLSGVFSLLMATAGFIAVSIVLQSHDAATEKMHEEMEGALRFEMAEQEDYYRRIMRDIGYNLFIIHKEQSESELRTLGYPTTYLDYEDVWKLAHGESATMNHLLPVLQKRIAWEEQNMEIMLSGIRGQVPVFAKPRFLTEEGEYRSPMTERVPDGMTDLGHDVATSLELSSGDEITIKGESFLVNRIYPSRGTINDMTVWIPLDKAQAIFGKEGKINGIYALECLQSLNVPGGVVGQVTAILPHVKVQKFSSQIEARIDVRQRAQEGHKEVVASVMAHRETSREQMERFASVLIPLLVFGAGAWIFILIYNNMRERRAETGIFRAVGISKGSVLKIFLAKAVVMGVAGGVTGCFLGLGLGMWWGEVEWAAGTGLAVLNFRTLLAGLLLAPVLSFLAGLLPALLASNQEPAVILRKD